MVSCRKLEKKQQFELNGKCSYTFINGTNEPVNLQTRNQYLIPLSSKEIDTTLAPHGIVKLEFVAQANNFLDLMINNTEYKVFTQPGSVDSVKILDGSGKNNFAFTGELKAINRFLLRKQLKFKSVNAEILPRVQATQDSKNFEQVIQVNDSITKIHCHFLNENADKLPKWFIDFETKRQNYLNAHFKLNSFSYRRSMLDYKDKEPADFLINTIGKLPIHDEEMLGNTIYTVFLDGYTFYKSDLRNQKEMPNSNVGWQKRFNHFIEVANRELSGRVKDVFLAYHLSLNLEHKPNAFDLKWLELIKDKELKAIITKQSAKSPILPKGSPIPYFYLPDSSNNYFQPKYFKDHIFLINFWATWCKPCLKEFPAENKLVKKFAGKPVTILNICIESDSVQWKKIIRKYDLKTLNLFAQGNWSEKIKEQFGTQGLPHSILIDWKGNVVQNKCPKPSENIDQLITELLGKMESEKMKPVSKN